MVYILYNHVPFFVIYVSKKSSIEKIKGSCLKSLFRKSMCRFERKYYDTFAKLTKQIGLFIKSENSIF